MSSWVRGPPARRAGETPAYPGPGPIRAGEDVSPGSARPYRVLQPRHERGVGGELLRRGGHAVAAAAPRGRARAPLAPDGAQGRAPAAARRSARRRRTTAARHRAAPPCRLARALLSMPKRRHSASRLAGAPGNLWRASSSVSTTRPTLSAPRAGDPKLVVDEAEVEVGVVHDQRRPRSRRRQRRPRSWRTAPAWRETHRRARARARASRDMLRSGLR